jgi:hypothetical protein
MQSREIQALLAKMGMGQAGQSLPQYRERLRVMGLLAAMATEISKPTLSHWTHTPTFWRGRKRSRIACATPALTRRMYIPCRFAARARPKTKASLAS